MKYLVTVLMLLMATAANAAEMPKELRGYWCGNEPKYTFWVRCKEEKWDGMCCAIDRRGSGSEHSDCKALSVRRVDDYTWIINERCALGSVDHKDFDHPEIQTTRYTRKGVYLYMKEINYVEMPKKLRGDWCPYDDVSKMEKCRWEDPIKKDAVSIFGRSMFDKGYSCKPLSVRMEDINTWIIKEHCKIEGQDPIIRVSRYILKDGAFWRSSVK
jgi:hypothetical protein